MLNKSLLCMSRPGISIWPILKRCLSEVINLSPSEIENIEPSNETKEHPAKYPFQKLDYGSTLLSQTMLKVKASKTREKYGLILLEGKRLIQEAIDSGCEIETIFFSRARELNCLSLPDKLVKIYKTPYMDMKTWSSLTTPPGIIGIFQKPSPVPESQSSLPLTLICDQLREPGNLGSMIRNCAGVGARRVILTHGSTDLWDLKVLRGGAGAHFKIRIRPDVDWGEIEELVKAENSKLLLACGELSSVKDTFGRMLPVMPYWAADYKSRHNFIVIGGETEGLSSAAYEVAAKTDGCIITIPLDNNLESLNSVSAASVIMFEIKRQLTMAK